MELPGFTLSSSHPIFLSSNNLDIGTDTASSELDLGIGNHLVSSKQ